MKWPSSNAEEEEEEEEEECATPLFFHILRCAVFSCFHSTGFLLRQMDMGCLTCVRIWLRAAYLEAVGYMPGYHHCFDETSDYSTASVTVPFALSIHASTTARGNNGVLQVNAVNTFFDT